MAATPRDARFRDARADRPRWVHLLNTLLAPTAGWIGLSPDRLEIHAQREADRLGIDGLAFVEESRCLLESIESEARLHWLGRVAARDDVLRLMRTQIRVRGAIRDAPVDDVALMPPLFILGWPRTGSSHLLGLLAQDAANRALPYYESFDPVPPRGRDDRAARVDSMLRFVDRLAPSYQAIHPMKGTDPEECVALFMLAFRTLQFDFQYRVPSYVRLLRSTDPSPAHVFYRDVLRLIQRVRPGGQRWLLKDPTHLFSFETLCELFPDARFIQLHRNPADVFGSMSSLYAHTRALFSDAVVPEEIGHELLEGYWGPGLDELLEARARRPEVPVADLRYEDLMRDPLGAIEATYARLGISLSEQAGAAISAYAMANPQHAKGRHRYSLGSFGLSEEALRERFGVYATRFGIGCGSLESRSRPAS